MAGSQVMLTAEEIKYLVDLLDTALKETRIEEHRTRAPSYREHVVDRENVIVGLLAKLQQSPP